MKLSIIIPCKNEENNIDKEYQNIVDVLKEKKYEIIFVDDGSTDKTYDKLKELYKKDILHVKVISFSKTFDKDNAICAGLIHASGKYTCILDGNLNQKVQYINEMIDFLDNNESYDQIVINAEKVLYKESLLNKLINNLCYKVVDKKIDYNSEKSIPGLIVFRNNVKEAILKLTEQAKFSKTIFAEIGFNTKVLEQELKGNDIDEGINSINVFNELSCSIKPLKISITIGLMLLCAFVVYLIALLIQVLAIGIELNIICILILLFLLISGLHFIILGLIGASINKSRKNENNIRQIYIIKEKLGFKEDSIL